MSDWTEERVEQLKKLWLQGWSASQIAKELGSTTRNAVIGKIHRLNLVARQSPKMTPPVSMAGAMGAKAKTSTINVKTPASSRSEYMPPAVAFANLGKKSAYAEPVDSFADVARKSGQVHNPFAATTSYGSSLSQGLAARAGSGMGTLARQCQWPVGDPRSAGFHFCGCAPAESLPYCAEHARLAYQSSTKSRRVNVGKGDLHNSGTPDEREIMVRV